MSLLSFFFAVLLHDLKVSRLPDHERRDVTNIYLSSIKEVNYD